MCGFRYAGCSMQLTEIEHYRNLFIIEQYYRDLLTHAMRRTQAPYFMITDTYIIYLSGNLINSGFYTA